MTVAFGFVPIATPVCREEDGGGGDIEGAGCAGVWGMGEFDLEIVRMVAVLCGGGGSGGGGVDVRCWGGGVDVRC